MSEIGAHEKLIQSHLNWNLITSRLERFQNIASSFPIKLLQKRLRPFGCHYMAFRLGTWGTGGEALLAHFDELLDRGRQLSGWNHKHEMLSSGDYGSYWSLLWELQVANFLVTEGFSVRWLGPANPDIQASKSNEDVFVECFCLQRSFDLEQFIGDLLRLLDAEIQIDRDRYRPLPLSGIKDRYEFLDRFFTPYLDPALLERARSSARIRYPVLLPIPPEAVGLKVYLDGHSLDNYAVGAVTIRFGDPESYLQDLFVKLLRSKETKNNLEARRPNVLATNLLLDHDTQAAIFFDQASPKLGQLPPSINALLWGVVGINQRITRNSLQYFGPMDHPMAFLAPP